MESPILLVQTHYHICVQTFDPDQLPPILLTVAKNFWQFTLYRLIWELVPVTNCRLVFMINLFNHSWCSVSNLTLYMLTVFTLCVCIRCACMRVLCVHACVRACVWYWCTGITSIWKKHACKHVYTSIILIVCEWHFGGCQTFHC